MEVRISSSARRMTWSSRNPAGAMAPAPEARTSTARTWLVQLVSPGSRPMTLTGRQVSPKYDLTVLLEISACARFVGPGTQLVDDGCQRVEAERGGALWW
jgi:multidrug efflux pump subunit AcrA (membrane-fusion protein)